MEKDFSGALNAQQIIDQLYVNGDLDPPLESNETRNPLPLKLIAQTAFAGFVVRKEVLHGVLDDLRRDPRYAGTTDDGLLMFRPELSEGSRVTPSQRAFVAGTAHGTPEQAARIWRKMTRLTRVLLENHSNIKCKVPGVIGVRDLKKIFGSAGIRTDYDTRGALMLFMVQDEQAFTLLPDGRIVINQAFNGNIEDIEPLKLVEDVAIPVAEVLPAFVNRSAFKVGAVVAAIQQAGYQMPTHKRHEVEVALERTPGVTRIRSGLYTYSST